MIRRVMVVLLSVAFLSTCLGAYAMSRPARRLEMSAAVEGFLRYVQPQMQTELVVCLTGDERSDYVVVDGIEPTEIRAATKRTVFYEACKGRHVVGAAHTHPPDAMCAFSKTDDDDFFLRSSIAVDVLVCGRAEIIYRTRSHAATRTFARR